MGGKHNNTRYRLRDELPCRAPGRFRRGSILSSKALDAWRTLCGKRCANTLWTNPDVCLSGSYVYLSFLLFSSFLSRLPGGFFCRAGIEELCVCLYRFVQLAFSGAFALLILTCILLPQRATTGAQRSDGRYSQKISR